MRSVWSRDGPGSRRVLTPPAASAARIRQDLTWALATGSVSSSAVSGRTTCAWQKE
ncbi:MAG: hypothetical protein WC328_03285 [Kiritimatiellia bacterium]|jgi:hypothetical protein|nr:hypothetical protein [Kiritimatiellia bacterium]